MGLVELLEVFEVVEAVADLPLDDDDDDGGCLDFERLGRPRLLLLAVFLRGEECLLMGFCREIVPFLVNFSCI